MAPLNWMLFIFASIPWVSHGICDIPVNLYLNNPPPKQTKVQVMQKTKIHIVHLLIHIHKRTVISYFTIKSHLLSIVQCNAMYTWAIHCHESFLMSIMSKSISIFWMILCLDIVNEMIVRVLNPEKKKYRNKCN